jgi:hypothetical protein
MKIGSWTKSRSSGLLLVGLSLVDCFSPSTSSLARSDGGESAPPSVLEVRPRYDVAPDAMVVVALSEQVMLLGTEIPVSLKRSSGDLVRARAGLSATGSEIELVPYESWPVADVISIEIGAGLVGRSGLSLDTTAEPLEFETVAASIPSMSAAPTPMAETPVALVVRTPVPGSLAPLNLQFVSVALSPSMDAAHLKHLVLTEEGGRRVMADVVASSAGGMLLAQLPPFRGPCDPLCAAHEYRVSSEENGIVAVDGPRGAVLTSTAADVELPTLTSSTTIVRGDQVAIDLAFTEPVLIRGVLGGRDGSVARLTLPLTASRLVRADEGAPLQPDTDYTFSFEGSDLAGNPVRPMRFEVHTLPRIDVAIDEIVAVPMHDWNDSDGIGAPFDPYPGEGEVTSSDQWVELINVSGSPIDLTTSGLALRAIDSSPTETILGTTREAYFGDGGTPTRWWPGEAIVLHPKGTLSRRGFVLEVVLGPRLLDRVAVGDVDRSVSPSTTPPDGRHEALAKDAMGRWLWCVPTPGDPLVSRDCS